MENTRRNINDFRRVGNALWDTLLRLLVRVTKILLQCITVCATSQLIYPSPAPSYRVRGWKEGREIYEELSESWINTEKLQRKDTKIMKNKTEQKP